MADCIGTSLRSRRNALKSGTIISSAGLCDTALMLADVAASVISNRQLSADYNVVALDAPSIAQGAEPGQFVMVKAGRGHDPLLRRPFSVFEVLRDGEGRASGISILSKRIGPSTSRLYDVRPGEAVDCLGPLGRP